MAPSIGDGRVFYRIDRGIDRGIDRAHHCSQAILNLSAALAVAALADFVFSFGENDIA